MFPPKGFLPLSSGKSNYRRQRWDMILSTTIGVVDVVARGMLTGCVRMPSPTGKPGLTVNVSVAETAPLVAETVVVPVLSSVSAMLGPLPAMVAIRVSATDH